jgi:hypothetical protein
MSKLTFKYWFGRNLFQNNIPMSIVNSTEMMVLRQTTLFHDREDRKIKLANTDKQKPTSLKVPAMLTTNNRRREEILNGCELPTDANCF